jgi:DNA-binding CsgD family transcriptional regulator/tetratricopeptide (TPR) repeat protein
MSTRREQALADTPTFVGRERDVAQLRLTLQHTLDGHGGLVLVSGEAGIGKSTLVQHLVSEVRDSGPLVLTGAAYDLSATPPYGPWLELIRDYPAYQNLPPLPEFWTSQDAVAWFGGQEALHHAVLAFFHEVSESRPLLIVLEDLHWADQSSLDLLRLLARSIQNQAILVVATYRDDEVTRQNALHRLLPSLIRESSAERVDLLPLSESAIHSLIEQQYHLNASEREELVRHLLSRGEGNPLFTVELLRALQSKGTLRLTEQGWRLAALTGAPLPSLVQQMTDQRMSALSPESFAALQVAAVIGQVVPLERWERVAERASVFKASEDACEAFLVIESPGHLGVVFRHALVREAVYESIRLLRRVDLHRIVAESYLVDARPDPETVAYHLQRAGDPRTAEWLIRAGEQAESQLAFLEACERYRQAVEIFQRDGADARQVIRLFLKIATLLRFLNPPLSSEYFQSAREAALDAGEHGAAAYALFRIGFNRANLRDAGRGLEDMRNGVRAMIDAPEDVERIGRWFAPSWTKAMSSVEEGISALAFFQAGFGRYQEAIETAEQYLGGDWRDSGESAKLEAMNQSSAGLVEGFVGMGVALANLGQPEVATMAYRMTEKALNWQSAHGTHVQIANTYLICLHFPYRTQELNERREYTAKIEGRLEPLRGMMGLANITWGYEHFLLHTGRWTTLSDLIRSKEPPRIFGFWSVSMAARARFALCRGDYDHAWDILRELLPEGPQTLPHDNIHFLPGHAHRTAAELAIETGELGLAREWIEAHDRWLDWSGAVSGRAEGLLCWARLLLADGNTGAATERARQALAQAFDPEQPLARMAIHRFLGELATRAGDYPTAADHLRYSHELANASALPFEHALTSIAIAELAIAQGSPADPRKRLAAVRKVCADLGATPTLHRIESLIATLRPREGDVRFGLTPREIDVLRHLARGMSDKEIADELFISHRTVMNHVSSILRKLDVESRAAAAAVAVREQLA